MFSHLSDLLSGDNTAQPAPSTGDSQQDQDNGATSPYNSNGNSKSNEYLVPDEEEPMEEIAFEATRTGGIIMPPDSSSPTPPPPPPPHGSNMLPAEDDDVSSSNAIVNGESKQKRGFSMWGSKSKNGGDDDDSAVAAVPVNTSKTDSEMSDGVYGKAILGIEPVQEKAPSSSTYEQESGSHKKNWLICLAVLLVIVAVVVPCAILIPRNNAAQANTADNNTGGETSDNTGGDGTEGEGTTFAPTAAPTLANGGLPQECEPAYESLDSCLLNEITTDEADNCIDCVFGFLPDNTGPCEVLEASVCNVLAQCECLSCTDELEEYLDCQSACELNCVV